MFDFRHGEKVNQYKNSNKNLSITQYLIRVTLITVHVKPLDAVE